MSEHEEKKTLSADDPVPFPVEKGSCLSRQNGLVVCDTISRNNIAWTIE